MKLGIVLVCGMLTAAAPVAFPPSAEPTHVAVGGARPVPASALGMLAYREFGVAPTNSQCQASLGVSCYTPAQLQAAYDVEPLHEAGVTGAGRTIAIVVPFGSPTIEQDLQVFDQQFGIADPPSIRTITPAGDLPPFDAGDPDMAGWAFETTLDVQWAHVIAPEANILVVATPVAETEGVQGFPEIVAAERYVVEHGLADVISQSFAATEDSFPPGSLLTLRGAFVEAAARGVTVLGAAGDTGATSYLFDETTLESTPVVSWPSSDPLVTSVGGTSLQLDGDGTRTAPDSVWNDAYGSGGGGRSSVFARPVFQNGVRSVVGAQRGTPDVAMSGAVDGGVLVYTSYDSDGAGWSVVGGTSEATPLFAGVVALACDLANHSLGDLNPALYALSRRPAKGLVDVSVGDNSYGDVSGYPAGRGYDLASGLGTVDAAQLVPALAASARPPQR